MDNRQKIDQIISNVEKIIIGKTEVIKLALAAILAECHILFECSRGRQDNTGQVTGKEHRLFI